MKPLVNTQEIKEALTGKTMEIPDFQTIMLPLLKFLRDEKEHSVREAIEHISNKFNLSEGEQRALLPSGQQPIIDNRVGWARTYMKKAGLLEDPRRGHTKITGLGLKILAKNPPKINVKFLNQFEKFVEFRTIKKEQSKEEATLIEEDGGQTPDEMMDNGYNTIRASLSQDLLTRLMNSHPSFFENVVLMLLSNMGYGEGRVTGRSGDEGIDGFVNQDKLGIDKIYFQAKRYAENNPVSTPMLRNFIGALEQHGASKGVFITTSRFPKNPKLPQSKRIILINGNKLVQLMIDNDVGVTPSKSYVIKRIDTDFFEED